MMSLSPASVVLVVAVGLFTAAAAIWDWRYWKIPNKLTFPTFALGLVYQAVFHGLPGLGDAALGFLVGFGVLFLLWMVGGGGGGDAKLMGGLSVWLGFQLTLLVLIFSTLLVILGTGALMLRSVLTKGFRGTQDAYLATGKTKPGKHPKTETAGDRQKRRVMGYAVPVAASDLAGDVVQAADAAIANSEGPSRPFMLPGTGPSSPTHRRRLKS